MRNAIQAEDLMNVLNNTPSIRNFFRSMDNFLLLPNQFRLKCHSYVVSVNFILFFFPILTFFLLSKLEQRDV